MILCIVGPTGVGKTKLSLELAKKYNAIIINCDSMQIYKDLDIGTAKIKDEEKENVPHYLFDIKDVSEDYSVFDYQKDARKIIEDNKDKNIIFVGGTGLYLKAALFDYRFSQEEKNNNSYIEYSNEKLYELALKKDPNHNIHINNRKRLIRFLNKEKTELVEPKPLYEALFIGLTTDRNNLYKIIDNRVDKMINDGLVNEVKYFYDKGIYSKAIQTGIGYKELYDYFDGKVTLDEAISKIKQNSRHYAKRQYTFFNNQLPVKYFNTDYNNFDNTINEIIHYIDNVKESVK